MTTSARDSGVLLLETPASAPDPALSRVFKRAMDGLFMVFQPIVSWREREIVAYEALVRTCEPELARPDLLEIQRILHREQPYTFLWEPRRVCAVRDDLTDVRPNALSSYYNLAEWRRTSKAAD